MSDAKLVALIVFFCGFINVAVVVFTVWCFVIQDEIRQSQHDVIQSNHTALATDIQVLTNTIDAYHLEQMQAIAAIYAQGKETRGLIEWANEPAFGEFVGSE